MGEVDLPRTPGNDFPVDSYTRNQEHTGSHVWNVSDLVSECWDTDTFGFDQRLPWKSASDVLDAYGTSRGQPYEIVRFWANSARSLPYDSGFPASGFNWTRKNPFP